MTSGSLNATRLPERTPDRPGPGPTPEALLRALDVVVRRRVEALLSGEYRSSSLGIGTELAQLRPYQPGDDVRRMDWNVTARTREPHVRDQVAERALVSWLLLVAALRGFPAPSTGNAASSGQVWPPWPRVVGPSSMEDWQLSNLSVQWPEFLWALLLVPAALAAYLLSQRRRSSYAVRFTNLDLLANVVTRSPGWRRHLPPVLYLLSLAGRHDVVAVEIRDQREQELPDVGELLLVDPETGRTLRVDTHRRGLRERFAAAAANERSDLERELRLAGADHVVLWTAGDWLQPFAGFLRHRQVTPQAAGRSGRHGPGSSAPAPWRIGS